MKQKLYQWLIRIDKKENLRRLLDGTISFSIPQYWRKIGDGINDISEGVLAIELKDNHISYIPGDSRKIKNILKFSYDNKNYILDSRIDYVPTLCFYSFEYNTKYHELPKKYFDDFIVNKEDYGFIVIEAKKFNERLKEALSKFGFKSDDLFFHSIKYIKKDDSFSTLDKFPYELLYKDKHYEYQNEVRFFITSTDNLALEKLKSNAYYVDVNLSDLISGLHTIPGDNEYASFTRENDSYILAIKERSS